MRTNHLGHNRRTGGLSAIIAQRPARSKNLRPNAQVRQSPERFERIGRAGAVRVTLSAAEALELTAQRALTVARGELYRIAGGSYDSNDVTASRLTVEQRLAYFNSKPFKSWVAAEKACGRQVFWLKDVDKTQAAGDIFTFFFKWRADNNGFNEQQNDVLKSFLKGVKAKDPSAITDAQIARVDTSSASDNANLVLALWQSKEAGGPGIGLLDFWAGAFWPTQIGLTRDEKLRQVQAFAPTYAKRVFPHIPEENRALERAGVHVVIVSNGDQELAQAAAPILGVKPNNVVGSNLLYDANGVSTGVNHAYEIFGNDWNGRPQPGKPLSFHYWMNDQKDRWNWAGLDENRIVIAGRDGDSAASDGGMMTLMMKPAALGNFMIDTPNEPDRAEHFHQVATKYGWTKGQFFTLVPSAPPLGATP